MAKNGLSIPEWRFYGRRKGRRLNASRQKAMSAFLPIHAPPPSALHEHNVDPRHFYPDPDRPLVLEIGFGNGERLAEMMRREPENNYLAAEPFINGVSAFLCEDGVPGSANLKIWSDDIIPLVRNFRPACLDKIYVLNPDPWHKKRHHQRRIINPGSVTLFSSLLKPGGHLILTTDVPDLADWMTIQMTHGNSFEWIAESQKDWNESPPDWIPTRYEEKQAKGADRMTYLIYKRL